MNKSYKFSLGIIFLIFLFIESSELKKIDYSLATNTIDLNNSNNNILLEKYLINELADINEISHVSVSSKNEENSEIEKFKIKTKTRLGKNSIYVEALQSISYSKKINSFPNFSFLNLKDPISGPMIRPTLMLEAKRPKN